MKSNFESAILKYEGPVFIISHDRYFLNKVCNRIFHIENNKLTTFDGNYDEYIEYKKKNKVEAININSKNKYYNKKENIKNNKSKVDIDKIEQEINELEIEISELSVELNNPELYNNTIKYKQTLDKYAELENEKEKLTQIWLENMEE